MGMMLSKAHKHWAWLLISMLVVLASSVLAASVQAEEVPLDRVVAVVDDEAVMQSELDARLQSVRVQLRDQGITPPSEQSLRKQVLDRLVLDTIQLQMADRAGLEVDEEQLNAAIQRIANSNRMSLPQFRQTLAQEGIQYPVFRRQIRDQMLISQLRQQRVGDRVQITPAEVDQFMSSPEAIKQDPREFRVAHILIRLPEAPSPEQVAEAQDRAQTLLTQIRDGADFNQIALQDSSGEQALSGGDLGWRNALSLPSIFADEVVTMSVGDVAGPLRSSSGFHLIKLVDVRGDQQHLVQQTRVRHILLAPNAVRNDQETLALAKRLRQQLTQGADFATLAEQYSDDKGSKQAGGELGWMADDQLVPAFAQAMDTLAPGEISAPVKSRFGWHIIQVEQRRQSDVADRLRQQQVQQLLFQRRFEEELQNWLREIRQDAYVEIKD